MLKNSKLHHILRSTLQRVEVYTNELMADTTYGSATKELRFSSCGASLRLEQFGLTASHQSGQTVHLHTAAHCRGEESVQDWRETKSMLV